jgi:hypothetical protein
MSHGRPLVLPSGAGQSQGSALVTPAEALLPCPDQTQVGEVHLVAHPVGNGVKNIFASDNRKVLP